MYHSKYNGLLMEIVSRHLESVMSLATRAIQEVPVHPTFVLEIK